MKYIFSIILCFLFVRNIYSNPQDNLNECLNWIGKHESLLIERGAINHIQDVDLRQYGWALLRHFVWIQGNIGFYAQTSDGIITTVHSIRFANGVNQNGLILQNYTNRSEYEVDMEFVRRLVNSNNGRLVSTSDLFGIRSIDYEYFTREYKVNIVVWMNLENQSTRGIGSIDIKVTTR